MKVNDPGYKKWTVQKSKTIEYQKYQTVPVSYKTAHFNPFGPSIYTFLDRLHRPKTAHIRLNP